MLFLLLSFIFIVHGVDDGRDVTSDCSYVEDVQWRFDNFDFGIEAETCAELKVQDEDDFLCESAGRANGCALTCGLCGQNRDSDVASDVTIPANELQLLEELLTVNGGRIIYPGDDDFHKYSSAYLNFCKHRVPKAVIMPNTVGGLSATLALIKQYGVEWTVGVSRANQECTGITHGYYVNMRKFDTLEMSEDKKSVRVGAGTMINELRWYLLDQGQYYVLTPLCTQLSVVGPILGGGIAWHMHYNGRKTLAQTVTELTVMTSEGEVLTVTENQHPDLFFKLRGGGGQVGVVIEVVIDVYEKTESMSYAYGFDLDPACASLQTPENKQCYLDGVQWMMDLPSNVGVYLMKSYGNIAVQWAYIMVCTGCDMTEILASHPKDVTWMLQVNDADLESYYNTFEAFWSFGDYRHSGAIDYDTEIPEMILPHNIDFDMYMAEYSSELASTYYDLFEADNMHMLHWNTMKFQIDADETSGSPFPGKTNVGFGTYGFYGADSQSEYRSKVMLAQPDVKGQYINYLSGFSYENGLYGQNADRIHEIKEAYDPEGLFTWNPVYPLLDLPVCFESYHCTGHGTVSGTIEDGCSCDCEDGWIGERCSISVSLDQCESITDKDMCDKSENCRSKMNSNGTKWKKCITEKCKYITDGELCDWVSHCWPKFRNNGEFKKCKKQ